MFETELDQSHTSPLTCGDRPAEATDVASAAFACALRVEEDARLTTEWVCGDVLGVTGYSVEQFEAENHGAEILHDVPISECRPPAAICSPNGHARRTSIRARNGELRPVRQHLRAPWNAATGRLTRVVTVVVRERVSGPEADWLRENRLLEHFSYAAVHDLREPLRTITAYSELLKKKAGPRVEPEGVEYIDFLLDATRRMRSVIDGLADFSSIGRQGRDIVPADANAACAGALANLRAQLEEGGARVECGELPTVRADAAQLTRVFQNLIENAVKFRSDAPPHVRIDAQQEEGEWLFRVRDNGIGMSAEQTARAFDVLRRFHARSAYAGVGIGLAVCRQIIGRHGGRIWAESTLGGGTTMYFTLPERPALSGLEG